MSTFSTDLKLELIGTGEASGTWGADTNNNLNLIQQAIAGVETVTLSSGGTLTLVMTNKAISNARNMVIKFTTASIAASTICTVPDSIEKFYIFDATGLTNPTNLTIKTASGTGFTLDAAKIYAAYTDGTNLTEISLDTLGGTVAAAQIADSAVTTAKIADDAVTSAKIADDAVTLAKMAPGTDGNIISYDASGNPVAVATGTCGQVLTSAGAGAPPTFADASSGGTSWVTTKKTATFTAVAGEGYFCDTSGGVFVVNLPAGVAGAIVSVNDYARTFGTNAISIAPNGTDKISGVNAALTGATNGQTLELVYVDATQGWINTVDTDAGLVPTLFFSATGGTEVTTGDFRTHIFTGPGTFQVNGTAPGPSGNPNAVEYLVVAGGGAGGGSPNGSSPHYSSGAGGAGGMRFNYPGTCFTGVAGSFPITVGAGGTIQPSTPGAASTFSTITSAGGGGPNADGGSGGGGGSNPTGSGPGGAGNTPPVTPPQGADGGPRALGRYGGAGGGGGGACGSSPTSVSGGPGTEVADAYIGPAVSACYGTPGPAGRFFAGGGGGALIQPQSSGGGGSGGGGPGTGADTPSPGPAATPGTVNTGGGGGAAARYPGAANGGSGGSGIVMIRYKFQ